MSDNVWDDDTYEDDEEHDDSDNPVRAQMRRLEKENKALRKQIGARRDSELKAILKAKGVSPKLSKHFPKDKDVTDDTVAKFLADEFDIQVGDVKPADETPQSDGGTEPAASPLDAQDVDALRKIQQAQSGAPTPNKVGDTASRMEQLMDEALKTGDQSKFWEFLNSQGMQMPASYEG